MNKSPQLNSALSGNIIKTETQKPVRVYLGLGSNQEREKHLCAGLDALQAQFGPLQLSSVVESAAVGFEGPAFFNLVVGFNTRLDLLSIQQCVKAIEDANGRVRTASKFSGRTLDIDILTYGDAVGLVDGIELPRGEILDNAFVLWPLAELAPRELHPGKGISYQQLWLNYDSSQQPLTRVKLPWSPMVAAPINTAK